MKTDADLRQEVSNELDWDPAINSNAIGVAVKNGIVTLTGHLDNYSQKHLVEKAVGRVGGVKAIAMEVDVKLDADHKRSDTEIAQAAENALKWHSQVPDDAIQLKVDKGWITLTGDVQWYYQRRSAESAVRSLTGVLGVTNKITIKPSIAPADVRDRIREALKRHAEREAGDIEVMVTGSSVILSGDVDSWAERDAVVGATWSAPGITGVVNNIRISP